MAKKPQVHVGGIPNVDDPALLDSPARQIVETAMTDWADRIRVPMPKRYAKKPEMIGQKVTVHRCYAREHGDNEGCLCKLIGKKVEITGIRESPFVGTPTYYVLVDGETKRIQEKEWVETEQRYEDGELERVRGVLGHDYIEPE